MGRRESTTTAWRVWRMLARFQRRYWMRGLAAATLLAVSTVLQLPAPLVTRYLVDRVIPSGDLVRLHLLGAGLVGIVIGYQLVGFLYQRMVIENRVRVEGDLRREAWRCIAAAGSGALSRERTGYLEARLDADVDVVGDLFLETLLRVALQVTTLLVGAGLLVYLDVRLAALALGMLPVFLVVSRSFLRSLEELSARRQEAWAGFRGTLVELLRGLSFLRVLPGVEVAHDRYETELSRALAADREQGLRSALAGTVGGLVTAAVPLAVLWYGAARIIDGSFTLGGFLAFHGALGYVYGPARSLLSTSFGVATAMAAGRRILEVLELPREDAGFGRAPLPGVDRLSAQRVVVAAPGARPVGPVDLELQRGEWAAIVGPTGCGKTTLLRTLAGDLRPIEGTVLVEGRPIETWRRADLRRRIILVAQETWLLSGTVRENLLLARPGATEDELWEALHLAVLDRFVRGLAGGLDTPVEEAGASLSGGEGQRLCLARALLARPDVLLLDEVTAGLDPATEEELFARLRRWDRHPAIAWVTHRHGVLGNMDRVVDLGDLAAGGSGRVVVVEPRPGSIDVVEEMKEEAS